ASLGPSLRAPTGRRLDSEVMPSEQSVPLAGVDECSNLVHSWPNIRHGEVSSEAAAVHIPDRGEKDDWAGADGYRVGDLGLGDSRVPPHFKPRRRCEPTVLAAKGRSEDREALSGLSRRR